MPFPKHLGGTIVLLQVAGQQQVWGIYGSARWRKSRRPPRHQDCECVLPGSVYASFWTHVYLILSYLILYITFAYLGVIVACSVALTDAFPKPLCKRFNGDRRYGLEFTRAVILQI